MRNFTFYSPTEVIFGKDTEKQAGALLKKYGASKVLIHFGGGSVERSGLLQRVVDSVEAEGLAYVLFGGVQPNPRVQKVYEGIALGKREQVDFILAVGGGSVIDSAKAIAYGMRMDGDVWDLFTGERQARDACPVGCVLTIAAAGSEMGGGCVLTNEVGGYKRGYTSRFGFNKFAIMNPELTYTLPAYQTFCGCTDIIMHTLERYFHSGGTLELTDRIAEGLIKTVMEAAKALMRDPRDYQARAEVMWAGSLSHNDLTGCGGGRGSWVPHKLQNELGGKYDVAHGASLAAVWGSWARFVCRSHPERFAKLAAAVFDEEEAGRDVQALGELAITKMEAFFREIGMPTSLKELNISVSDEDIEEMSRKCTDNGKIRWGDIQPVGYSEVVEIYRAARDGATGFAPGRPGEAV